MAVLLPIPYQQFTNPVTGTILSYGMVYTYAAGTTTPKATYSDQAGTIPLTNPIYLDAEGMPLSSLGGSRVHIWVDGSYKYVTQDQFGVQVDSVDNVTSFVPGGSSAIDINGMTQNTVPDYVDTVPTYDVSALANRKVTIGNILGLIGPVISGFIPSGITGSSTTSVVSISSGNAVASNAPILISGVNYSWNVANGNSINGYQGGSTLPNSSTIHFFVCMGATGTGSFASTSLTPTLPTGYDVAYRRIFSLKTDSVGNLIPVTAIENDGGSLVMYLATPAFDINGTVFTTASTITGTLVPTGVKHQYIGRIAIVQATTSTVIISSLDEPDLVPATYATTAGGGGYGYDIASNANFVGTASTIYVTTNTSAQFRSRASVNVNVACICRGWKDFRRA